MGTPKWDAAAVEAEEEVQRVNAELGRLIARILEEQGISTTEMAEILGVHTSYVAAVRTGVRHGKSMSFRSAAKFLLALGYRMEIRVVPISRDPTSSPEPSSLPPELASPSSPLVEGRAGS